MNFTRQTLYTNQISLGRSIRTLFPRGTRRPVVALLLICLALWPGQLGQLTREMIVDAYTQVSVFVAATLLLVYGSERLLGFNIAEILKSSKTLEIPLAALLGAIPGCGGAVVVVAAYSSGHASFGAVVATLIATMGDAAFLLIATRPDAAAVVLPLSFLVAVIFGWIVHKWGPSFQNSANEIKSDLIPRIGKTQWTHVIYLVCMIPGLILGVCQLFQVDIYQSFGILPLVVSILGTFIGLYIWTFSPVKAMSNHKDTPVTRMSVETSFISVWVIGAYLLYEYMVAFTPIDLNEVFQIVTPLLPLAGVLVGFIPGCGPQVLVTALYINGLLPFAALMGNAISNDGDALFPAIAVNPKVAFWATIISAIPALIVAYGFYFLFPNFLN